jgi:hypothetical protein
MHVGAPRPESSDVGMAKQGGRGEASQKERPDVARCRDEVAARRRAEPVRWKGGVVCPYPHRGRSRPRMCPRWGCVNSGGVARWPGGSSARSHATGRKQCPQPCDREEAGPAAMRPGGSSARHCPQPCGREGTVPAAMRPGGRSARSHARGREKTGPAAMRPGGGSARGPEAARREQVPAAMRPGGRSARGPEAVGGKQRPQPTRSGREKAAPAAMRPGGRSARSQAAERRQCPQP